MIISDYFKFLDHWFYTVGVKVCPADTRNKTTSENWNSEQNSEMSLEEYEQLKKECLKELWKAYVAANTTGVLELPTRQHDSVLTSRNAMPKPSE